ncbi:DUF805 domain-containing protein [Microvirga sp. TS319]|uniref:DUF805 domain-containing protein n=1 Tax=Microvirga sp. TS319 TaxID=3241165 RepID=UPI003519E948
MNFEVLKKNVEQAVRTGLGKFADFSGRSSRPEYWYFMLPVIVLMILASMLDSLLLDGMSVLGLIVALAALVPTLSAGARRLHDTDRSGWWLLIGLVPFIGALGLIYLCCQPGSPGSNRFGPAPSSATFGALAQA